MFKKDHNGQLLLLTGIILTIALLISAYILLNIVTQSDSKRYGEGTNIHREFIHLKSTFGQAVEAKAREYYYTRGELSRLAAVNLAYNDVVESFVKTERKNGIDLRVDKRSNIFTKDYVSFQLRVDFMLSDGVTTIKESVDYDIVLALDDIVMANNNGWAVVFSDDFTYRNEQDWVYSPYQKVPYFKNDVPCMLSEGTGTSYGSDVYRTSHVSNGYAIKFRFMLSTTSTKAMFYVYNSVTPSIYWGIKSDSNQIYVEYNAGSGTQNPKTLIDPLKTHTWYIGLIVINDVTGFYISVYEQNNPDNCGTYIDTDRNMPSAIDWIFRHRIWQDYSYIADYMEFIISEGSSIMSMPFRGSTLFGDIRVVNNTVIPASISLATGDFDGDGDADIVYTTSGYYPRQPYTVAWYHFNEQDGTVARDGSGHGNNATLYNNVDFTNGYRGNCINFDDIDERVALPHTVLNGSEDFTVEMWIKTTDTVAGLISCANNENYNEFLIYVSGGKLVIYLKDQASPTGTITVSDGSWHHIAVVRAGNSVLVYVDGNLDIRWNSAPTTPLKIYTNGLWLADEQDTLGGGWDPSQAYLGLMDELRIIGRALNYFDIKRDYNVGTGGAIYYYERIGYDVEYVYQGQIGSFNDWGCAGDIIVGDFNKDHNLDFAVSNEAPYPYGEIKIFFGDGTGKFPYVFQIKYLDVPCKISVGDFNEDGNTDILGLLYGGNVLYFLPGSGNGSFDLSQRMQALTLPFAMIEAVYVGDFVTHGHIDAIVLCGEDVGLEYFKDWAYLFYARGDGLFIYDPLASGIHNVIGGAGCVFHINTDPYIDILLYNWETFMIQAWYNSGSGAIAGIMTTPSAEGYIPYGAVCSVSGPQK